MASSFLFPTSASSVLASSLIFIFILFNCCHCQPHTFSLKNYACAKQDADFHNGLFTLIKDNRLRIDPSKQTINNSGAQLDALLLNHSKKERLVISVVFVKGGQNCKQLFIEHVQRPSCCLIGDEMDVNGNHGASGECKVQKCTSVNVTCSGLPMDSVENLEDSRHFKLSVWNNVSDADNNKMAQCEWIAFIDDIRILLNKEGTDSGTLEEHCWKKKVDGGSGVLVVLLLVSLFVILLVAVSMAVFFYYLRRRKRTIREIFCSKKKKKRPAAVKVEAKRPKVELLDSQFMSSNSSNLASVAAKKGVEVPNSLRSDSSSDDDDEDDEEDKKETKGKESGDGTKGKENGGQTQGKENGGGTKGKENGGGTKSKENGGGTKSKENGGGNQGKESGGGSQGKESGGGSQGKESGDGTKGKENGGQNQGKESGGGNHAKENGGGNHAKENGGGNKVV